MYRLGYNTINWNETTVVDVRSNINVCGVKEGKTVIWSTLIFWGLRLLTNPIISLKGLIELLFSLILQEFIIFGAQILHAVTRETL